MDDRLTQALAALSRGAGAAAVDLRGRPGHLPSRLDTEAVAVACAAAALMAAADLQQSRTGSRPTVALERAQVAAAVRSERHFRVAGAPAAAGFAPLSRFWRTADGWLRTHANFPWHQQALLAVAGTSEDPAAVGAALAARPGADLEAAIFAAGGVAARVRAPHDWAGSAAGEAVAAEPLIGARGLADAPPRSRRADVGVPAEGLRVLDLTRVIAGPVCTRLLGALGADVLRLDAPGRPDVEPGAYADTLLGKRSAFVDFARADGAEVLHTLLEQADVLVTGYRPGALERFGLGDDTLAERHPGLVIVRLSAWGHAGPWYGRRGFDSIVQAATGIAAVEAGPDAAGGAAPGAAPGVLPCQLLDHGTGYLAAAAALEGVRRQAEQGGTPVRTLSLARTAHWLLESATRGGGGATGQSPAADDPDRWVVGVDGVSAVTPPGELDGRPLRWPAAPGRYGRATATWSRQR